MYEVHYLHFVMYWLQAFRLHGTPVRVFGCISRQPLSTCAMASHPSQQHEDHADATAARDDSSKVQQLVALFETGSRASVATAPPLTIASGASSLPRPAVLAMPPPVTKRNSGTHDAAAATSSTAASGASDVREKKVHDTPKPYRGTRAGKDVVERKKWWFDVAVHRISTGMPLFMV